MTHFHQLNDTIGISFHHLLHTLILFNFQFNNVFNETITWNSKAYLRFALLLNVLSRCIYMQFMYKKVEPFHGDLEEVVLFLQSATATRKNVEAR